MKILHLADLHIGKKINEFSMIEDQKFILKQILEIMDDVKPDAVIIAGDVYDKTVPTIEAVELLDDFIFEISKREISTFIISGNHDSAERLSFGAKVMKFGKIYISPVFDGKVSKYTLSDENGKINFYLLPFLKPVNVKKFFLDEEINSYDDAAKLIVKNMNIDVSQRNILIAHQFVTETSQSELEEKNVGGLDNISSEIFYDFDYVALGHIHRAYNIGEKKRIRYCGSPLKYSLSEINSEKSVTIVEINSKNDFKVETVALVPLRDMQVIKGTFEEITKKSFYCNVNTKNYISIILTDENEVPNALQKLRDIYENILKLEYNNKRTQKYNKIDFEKIKKRDPFEVFSEFYELQNNQKMTTEQEEIIKNLIDEIWEVEL